MKSLVIVASLFLAVNALDKEFIDNFVTKVKAIGEECIPETSASKDDINNLLSFTVPSSHEGKCLIFCFHKHFHIQNEDGSLDKAGALQALQPLKEHDSDVYDKVVKVFQTCADQAATDSDPCIYSANLVECALKEGKAMGLHDLIVVEME
ncbi:hypothetical protein MTP99_011506 [Tenebrio molitor]|uniref:Uncharacterized protein n=1 Tax=Tenebrio molitor TaxID=7067 RepID=A0A8J6LPM3_TENMO|nr:hypothetical protein GEV33_002133 [Tenebrio molitor]KAJ3630304.1 hypothetical protein MTP99_011506 [Tenebrio molitor]CAH1369999.1 unnamed protein product [Tenebrio molitor]